jgi:hypothetical protein
MATSHRFNNALCYRAKDHAAQPAASHPSALRGWSVDRTPCAHLGVRLTGGAV